MEALLSSEPLAPLPNTKRNATTFDFNLDHLYHNHITNLETYPWIGA
jgi:hypothetical protein